MKSKLTKLIKFFSNYSKYQFKCLLTKDPSEKSSLKYIVIINCTVSFFYYAVMYKIECIENILN